MSDKSHPPLLNVKRRMDFEMEVAEVDETTRRFTVRLTPNPKRYETVKRDGKTWLRDRYLDEFVSLEDMTQHARGLPLYYRPPSVEDPNQYASERKTALDREFTSGEYSIPSETAAPHRDLESNLQPREMSFLSVDICASTALRKADPLAFDFAHHVLIRELGTLVGQFNGALMKTTGDGFIAYVDHPSFTTVCDSTVALGLALLVVLRESVNPALKDAGINPLHIRIGADYGEVQFRSIVIPATGFSTPEVASDALNRAVKIQESCEPGQLRIGRTLYELVHVQWLERAREVSFRGNSVGIPEYRVYVIE